MYVKNEERTLRCLDLDSGAIIWEEKISGTCSQMAYLNGVIYMVGGGDSDLYAVDAKTGKHYWKLQSPEKAKNSWADFFDTSVWLKAKMDKRGMLLLRQGLMHTATKRQNWLLLFFSQIKQRNLFAIFNLQDFIQKSKKLP